MGVLSYPRIHFRGTFTVNPATADNDDVAVAIDPVNVKLLPILANQSDAAALAWLTAGVPAISPLNQQTFQYLRGGWNPFGNLTTGFVDVRVCSTLDSDGLLQSFDPLVGGWVSLNGSPANSPHDPPSNPKMCDLDPSGSAVTQIFLGGFQLGGPTLGLTATCDRKAFGRWVSFRNAMIYPGEQNFPGAGAVWQFAFPKRCLIFINAEDSPALAALETAVNEAMGIVVQFATFQVVPSMTDADLIAILQNPASTQSNPATGLIVGTVGVWNEGEAATVPDGRVLLLPEDQSQIQQVVGPAAAFLGPATAYVQPDNDVVSLNLVSTFPENGYASPLAKANFGRVRLGVILQGSDEPIEISDPIDYDYGTYALTAGIIDVEYNTEVADRDMLDQGTLVLLTDPDQNGDPVPILVESERIVTVVSVGDDDTGVYLDVNKAVDLSIVVTERGGPPSDDVTVYLREYQYVTDPGDSHTRAMSTLHEVGSGVVRAHRLDFDREVVFEAGKTDPLEITVTASKPGAAVIVFTLDDNPPPGDYPWGTAVYAGFRVLPDDDYSHIDPRDRVAWDFMYQHVFRYFRLVFPAMSNVVPFDNQAAMESAAQTIYELTDPSLNESTRYMPVSRDLSTGKRGLIVDWYNHLKPSFSGTLKQKGASFRTFFWP